MPASSSFMSIQIFHTAQLRTHPSLCEPQRRHPRPNGRDVFLIPNILVSREHSALIRSPLLLMGRFTNTLWESWGFTFRRYPTALPLLHLRLLESPFPYIICLPCCVFPRFDISMRRRAQCYYLWKIYFALTLEHPHPARFSKPFFRYII